jgi:signal transduction histidine kinase
MSLRTKVLAAIIGVTVIVLTLNMGVILYELFSARQEFVDFDRKLRRGTIQSRAHSVASDAPLAGQVFVRDVIHVEGEDAEGRLTVKKGKGTVDQDRVRAIVRRAIRRRDIIDDGDTVAIPSLDAEGGVPLGGTYFLLDIPDFSPHVPLQKGYVVMLFGIVIIIVVTYLVLSRAVIRPVERLERAAVRVAGGDYTRPVPLSGRNDEIDTFIQTFNGMMVEVGAFRQYLEERMQDARDQARKAEKTLVIAQRLAATGKLASGIAHEVNNPLAGMINAVRRLQRLPAPKEEKRVQYLELILDGLTRVRETVKKILQFTPHKVAPQPVGLGTFIEKALSLANHRIESDGIEVVVDVSDGLHVFGDPFELEQVILNLLINSMDAMAETDRSPTLDIRAVQVRGDILLTIADNGSGMSEEQISQAFDMFFTTKEVGEGTGLGLSIAHNVIENHGGRLEISSEDGEGTTVSITLPLLAGGS